VRHDYAAADGQDSADLEIRIAVHAEVLGAPGAWRGVRVYELKARLEAGTDRTLDDWLPRADHQLNAAGLLFIGNVQVVEQVVSLPFSFQFFTRLAAVFAEECGGNPGL
jgi:hypothetical protein